MFDHVGLWASDLAETRRFYELLMERPPRYVSEVIIEWRDLALGQAGPARPPARGVHLGLAAGSREEVDRRWQAAVDAGFEAAGEPDARPEFGPDGYGGALRDPDGNSAAIVHHAQVRLDGDIDHLWLRVADPDVSRAFYDTIAAPAGLERVEQVPGAYVQYVEAATGRGGLRLLAGEPATQPLHFAFIANGPEPVHAFHAAAVAAGYEDNGAPGERPQYHPGYYAAFVLDPDGHNVEVVFQGQP